MQTIAPITAVDVYKRQGHNFCAVFMDETDEIGNNLITREKLYINEICKS